MTIYPKRDIQLVSVKSLFFHNVNIFTNSPITLVDIIWLFGIGDKLSNNSNSFCSSGQYKVLEKKFMKYNMPDNVFTT